MTLVDLANARGIDRETGEPIGAVAHLRQSVTDILTTRVGTRIERRTYGSRLPSMVDRPMTPDLTVEVTQAVAEALGEWEPRLILDQVVPTTAERGRLAVNLRGRSAIDGASVQLDGIVVT